MRKISVKIGIFILLGSFLFANTPEFPNYFKDFGEMSKTSIDNFDDYYSQFAGITLVTGALIWKHDAVIRNKLVDAENKRFNNNLMNATTIPAKWYGANNRNVIMTFAGLTASTYLYGKVSDNNKSVETSYLLAESFIFTAGIIELSKFIIGRARPYNNLGNRSFGLFNKHSSHHSMPSGHTGIAFAMANTLAMSSDSYIVKIPCYFLAGSAGLQRVGFDVHWTSDIIIGGLIGYGVSTFLHNNYYDSNNEKSKPMLNINVVIPL